jgi:hypothetical protein
MSVKRLPKQAPPTDGVARGRVAVRSIAVGRAIIIVA